MRAMRHAKNIFFMLLSFLFVLLFSICCVGIIAVDDVFPFLIATEVTEFLHFYCACSVNKIKMQWGLCVFFLV